MDGSTGSFAYRHRRRWAMGCAVLILGSLLWSNAATAAKLRISNRYSPLNSERQVRKRTDYIVLHTTEGAGQSALRRIRRGGLAHYVVMRDGRVHRIISRQRVARHAGLSMWDGVRRLDNVSLGIEVVGYHNKPITGPQELALAELLRQLQEIFGIPDGHVLTHSMVAYGNRNRWHRHAHRGRKRCGMLFAQSGLRQRLGLESRPARDPDVAAGRLIVGDPYLATVLFGPEDEAVAVAESRFEGPDADVITADRTAWFIARDQYAASSTVYVFPDGRRQRGNDIRDWSCIPRGTRVLVDQEVPGDRLWGEIGRDGGTASEVAGAAYKASTTLYIRPDGRVFRGDQLREYDFRRLPRGTRVFVGFRLAGEVTSRRTAYDLCGLACRHETTLYLLPGGAVRNGREIRENSIPGGTQVLVAS